MAIVVISGLLLFENNCQAAKWTAMFYMAADDSLDYGVYRQAWEDIGELTKCAVNDQINLLVQLDAASGCARYLMTPGGPRMLAWLGRVNSGSDTVLADFGRWAVKEYPAERYMLVIWGHGYGWNRKSKDIGYDRYFHDQISIARGELKRGLARISGSIGKPLDLLVLDACLMQSAEVLSEATGLCQVAVGSQALLPMDGLPYNLVLPGMSGDRTAIDLAKDLIAACREYYQDGPEMTISAVDLNNLSNWSQRLNSLLGELSDQGLAGCIDYQSITESVVRFLPLNSYDMGGVLSLMKSRLSSPHSESVWQLKSSLPVVACYTNTPDSLKISGISVWHPGSVSGFYGSWNLYSGLVWSQSTRWDDFIFNSLGLIDSTCNIPQNLRVEKFTAAGYRLSWDDPHDISGISSYQVRAVFSPEAVLDDKANSSDTVYWNRNGFVWQKVSGNEGRYYSTGGYLTRREPVFIDTLGGLSWVTAGYRGRLTLALSEDTLASWDTVFTTYIYSDTTQQQYGLKLGQGYRWLRFSWTPETYGWVAIDDICSFKADSQIVYPLITGATSYWIPCEGFESRQFQVRAIDGCGNASGWGRGIYCQPEHLPGQRVWPNPGRGIIRLSFSASSKDFPRVKVFNIAGQAVAEMSLESGYGKNSLGLTEYIFSWNTNDNKGKRLPSGVYIYRISAGDFIATGKLILIH